MNIRELSPELAKKAKDELFEDPKRTSQDIQAIKDWIAKQPHLNVRMGKLVIYLILFIDFIDYTVTDIHMYIILNTRRSMASWISPWM